MKGVILAGGKGTRLWPITKVTNKHLLPVYNKPMIYYPLQTLIDVGIRDILIVSGTEHVGHFLHLLGSGKEFGIRLSYEVQDEAGGIAQALGLAERFADGDTVMVILGDNMYEKSAAIKKAKEKFEHDATGAWLFLKKVPDAHRFGVAQIRSGRIVAIEEKPKKPKSNLAVTGLYLYDAHVFDSIKTLKPSARGELEITDVNMAYVQQKQLRYQIVDGAWTDAGTFDSLLRANMIAARLMKKR